MEDDSIALQAVSAFADHLGNTLIEGIAEGNVCDNTPLEEGPRPEPLGAVNDLIRHDEIARLDLLLQTTDGGESNNASDADGAQSGNVRAGRDLVGSQLVVQAVSAQEGNGDGLGIVLAVVVQDGDRGRGLTPGRRDGERGNLSETWEFAQSGAADHGDRDGPCLT